MEEAKAELGASPGDHAFAPTLGERPAHIRYGDGSIPSGATKFSRCSEAVSRSVRDRETGGSIPLTSTEMPV